MLFTFAIQRIHWIMKQIQILVIFFILVTSCNGQNLPSSDPYFVLRTDTVSTVGPQSITRNILHDKNEKMWYATW